MRRLKSYAFALITGLVAMATLCALALPEEGGRDTFVRLTRTGLHRHWSPRTSSSEADELVAHVDPPAAPPGHLVTHAGQGVVAIIPDAPRVMRPTDELGAVLPPLQLVAAASPSGPPSDRAPPRL